jgi:multidrug efflux pump subunit AcrA (membrane-fusion protein)
MEEENKALSRRRKKVIKFAIAFFCILLVLTFFSNTIMNYSLPQVSTQSVTEGNVSNTVRGSGEIEASDVLDLSVTGDRKVKKILVEEGDKVKAGDVIMTFEDGGDDSELKQAKDNLEQLEFDYQKSLLKLPPDYKKDLDAIQQAKDDLNKAKDALETAKDNKKKKKDAEKELDKAKQAVKDAQAKVDSLQKSADDKNASIQKAQAEAKVKEAEKTLNDLKDAFNKGKKINIDTGNTAADADNKGNAGEDTSGSDSAEQGSVPTKADIDAADKALTDARNELAVLNANNDLKAAQDTLTSAQAAETLAQAKFDEYASKTTVDDAKADVKAKENALSDLILSFSDTKKQDDLNNRSEAMDMEKAQEQIQEARDKVDKLSKAPDLTELKAPQKGTIKDISAKKGDNVTKDSPVAHLELKDSGKVVKIKINTSQAMLVKPGMKAVMENFWDEDGSAVVTSLKPSDDGSGMWVTVSIKGKYLMIGDSLDLSIGGKSQRYDTVVPNNAIHEDNNGKFVYTIQKKSTPLGNRYIVKRSSVDVELSDDSKSGVSGSLQMGDYIVTNSSKPLKDGSYVRLAETES